MTRIYVAVIGVGGCLAALALLLPVSAQQTNSSASPQYQEPPPIDRSSQSPSPPLLSSPKSRSQPHTVNVEVVSPDQKEDISPTRLSEPLAGDVIRVQSDRGIRYVSGGVGEGERDALNALSDQFNLRLLFAMQGSGDYLSDVGVKILDSEGKVILSAQSRGPWFLTQLPPGAYTVEAMAMGQIQRQTAHVSAEQSQLRFYWR